MKSKPKPKPKTENRKTEKPKPKSVQRFGDRGAKVTKGTVKL